MDREQEDLQFLGLFGIYKESYKIILSWRKIFSQITLALIIPLSFIFLAHTEISHLLFRNIRQTEYALYKSHPGTSRYNRLSDLMSKELAYYWLFRVAYYIALLIFSLLSTSAVVYTIACIYTARDITFKKVMSIVPIVWKRLMVTFLCTFLCVFVYHIVFIVSIYIILIVGAVEGTNAFAPILIILLILYVAGFIYMTIIWQLASVVTVLEESYGFKAMVKSKNLIKGKIWVVITIFFKLNFSFLCLQILFGRNVVHGYHSWNMFQRALIGMLCLLLLFKLILFGLVFQTIIYFVCKSYHHENIDKSALSNHLEDIYLGEYVLLKSKDVQLEQYQA